MYVGSDNYYVKSLESTTEDTLKVQMGESDTATYFVRTTLFSNMNNVEYSAIYKVRVYAQLEDGSYVYSEIEDYSIYDIAHGLYQNKMMSTYTGHDYLYNNILTVVDSAYEAVDYNW